MPLFDKIAIEIHVVLKDDQPITIDDHRRLQNFEAG
jgi:hypothetical protein